MFSRSNFLWRGTSLSGISVAHKREIRDGEEFMQMSDASELRAAWRQKGDPPCEHPETDREYYLGSYTGDNRCTTCGSIVAKKNKIRELRDFKARVPVNKHGFRCARTSDSTTVSNASHVVCLI